MLWSGVAIQFLGMWWDGVWHSRHPGALEAGWALLQAHGIMYVGILVVGLGAALAFRRPGAGPGPTSWYAMAGYGALGQAIGTGWDAWAHAAGREAATAHMLSQFALLLVLLSVVAAAWTARDPG